MLLCPVGACTRTHTHTRGAWARPLNSGAALRKCFGLLAQIMAQLDLLLDFCPI